MNNLDTLAEVKRACIVVADAKKNIDGYITKCKETESKHGEINVLVRRTDDGFFIYKNETGDHYKIIDRGIPVIYKLIK
jgi:hypothetical protein